MQQIDEEMALSSILVPEVSPDAVDQQIVAEIPLQLPLDDAPVPQPVRPKSLDNLIQELDDAMDDMYKEGRLGPNPSSCTSLGSRDERIFMQEFDSADSYTCVPHDREVTSGLDVDDDIYVWCCGQFKLISRVYGHWMKMAAMPNVMDYLQFMILYVIYVGAFRT